MIPLFWLLLPTLCTTACVVWQMHMMTARAAGVAGTTRACDPLHHPL